VELENCLKPSILWLPTILYCKKLTIYILNLTNFDFSLLRKSFVDVVAFLNWKKLATRKTLIK
jgi:hypothetical protein